MQHEGGGLATHGDHRPRQYLFAPEPEEPAGVREQARGQANPPAWASAAARRAGLTAREWEVLTLLILGYPTKEMARQLFISAHTAYQHVARIRAKFGARSRAQVVAHAL